MKKYHFFALAALFSLCCNAQTPTDNLDAGNEGVKNDSMVIADGYAKNGRRNVQGAEANPFAPDNSLIVGTWRESATKTLTFKADGTTDYAQGYTYKCLPAQGNVLLYNARNVLVAVLELVDCSDEALSLSPRGNTTIKKYTKVEAESGSYFGHDYVNLGTGVKWATMNIGANSPEQYGDYFAWGETSGYIGGKSNFDWSNYDWCNGSFISQTKYCTDAEYGTVDNKTVLTLGDDAANKSWGGKWRMPTAEEQDKLRTECYWKWVTSYNGKSVNGYVVYKAKNTADKGKSRSSYTPVGSYSLSDAHIFLPAAGARSYRDIDDAGKVGDYWSSSLSDITPNYANHLMFVTDYNDKNIKNRCEGLTIRAVYQ